MKANVPEKLYGCYKGNGNLFVDYRPFPNDESVEYIRTEAFIDKACEFIKDNGSHYIDIVNGQLVLKKGIIKDFKKYMKGE